MLYLKIHLICAVYCFIMLIRRYRKDAQDGALNITPALDSIVVMILAVPLAVVDFSITAYKIVKKYYFKIKKDDSKKNQVIL